MPDQPPPMPPTPPVYGQADAPPPGTPQANGYWQQPGPYPNRALAPQQPTRSGPSGIAIAALALSGLSFLGVLVLTAIILLAPAADVVSGGGGSGGSSGSGTSGPLTGRLDNPPSGTLSPSDLQTAVTGVVQGGMGDVSGMTCPATPSVAQGVVTVCHGTVEGDEWAFAVFFEDAAGRFTVAPV